MGKGCTTNKLYFNTFECVMKMMKWHFKYHLCRARELMCTTYHPNHQQCKKLHTHNQLKHQHIPIVKIHRSTKTNKIPNATKLAKWTYQHLEDTMDVVEKGHNFLQKVIKYQNIPFTSISNHFNGRTRSRKMGPQGVPTKQEDATIITWVLNM